MAGVIESGQYTTFSNRYDAQGGRTGKSKSHTRIMGKRGDKGFYGVIHGEKSAFGDILKFMTLYDSFNPTLIGWACWLRRMHWVRKVHYTGWTVYKLPKWNVSLRQEVDGKKEKRVRVSPALGCGKVNDMKFLWEQFWWDFFVIFWQHS